MSAPARRTSWWVVVPAILALGYAIAVVVVAWRAPDKGFLGFTGQRIVHVEDGGRAEAAGLREGDVIVAANGEAVTSTLDYAFRVLSLEPGQTVVLTVDRDGVRSDATIVLGDSPPPWGALVATLLAFVLLVLGLIARIGRSEDPDARRFYRTALIYAVVYVGALSWTRLIVHPVLGGTFLVALFVGPAIARVARSDASVLLLGESGTGKGLLARTLHATSPRTGGPFMQVDCGAIAASVFESELFGHERGAFTGATRMRRGPIELAEGGTLFLDEIGEVPLELQPKLLRVLEERVVLRVGATTPVAVDVRIIAATHRKLEEMVARGEFREDLYFRLRVVEITVPPLRARRADLPALCAAVLPRVARRCGRAARPIADDAMARMMAYAWPGNVRELENVLERALVLGEGDAITVDDLELTDRGPVPEPIEVVTLAEGRPHDAVMEEIERRRLTAALTAAAGNQSTAAKALGMPRTTFINKLRRHACHTGTGTRARAGHRAR